MNRPEQLNTMTSELCGALRSIAVDRSRRVVSLTGAGRGFCAGLDLRGWALLGYVHHVRLGGYGTTDLRGGLDASTVEPIRSAMRGS